MIVFQAVNMLDMIYIFFRQDTALPTALQLADRCSCSAGPTSGTLFTIHPDRGKHVDRRGLKQND